MNTFPKFLLIVTLLFPNIVVAKPCGNGFIADNKVCHKDSPPQYKAPEAPKSKGALGSVCATDSDCKTGFFCSSTLYCWKIIK